MIAQQRAREVIEKDLLPDNKYDEVGIEQT